MKNGKKVILLILLSALIAIVPLMTIQDSEFSGSDDGATDLIHQLAPEYSPWFESVLEPPGGETESLLFALQAALGAGVIGAGFGFFVARKKYKR